MDNNRYFYIYLKQVNEKYNEKDVLKLGCTVNLYRCFQSYKTSSINKRFNRKIF